MTALVKAGGAGCLGIEEALLQQTRHRASTAAATSLAGPGSEPPRRAASRCKVSAMVATAEGTVAAVAIDQTLSLQQLAT